MASYRFYFLPRGGRRSNGGSSWNRVCKIRAATGSSRYYGHVVVGEREIRIVSIWTRWIHKSELVLVGKVPIGLTYIRFEMTADLERGSTRYSDFLENAETFSTGVLTFSNFLYHFDLLYVYTCIRQPRAIQLSSLCSPGLTSTSAFDETEKESLRMEPCPP